MIFFLVWFFRTDKVAGRQNAGGSHRAVPWTPPFRRERLRWSMRYCRLLPGVQSIRIYVYISRYNIVHVSELFNPVYAFFKTTTESKTSNQLWLQKKKGLSFSVAEARHFGAKTKSTLWSSRENLRTKVQVPDCQSTRWCLPYCSLQLQHRRTPPEGEEHCPFENDMVVGSSMKPHSAMIAIYGLPSPHFATPQNVVSWKS